MQTVTVYIQDDRERKRRKKKRNVVALLLATGIANVALGDRKAPVVRAAQAVPSAGPELVEKIVYVDRPILTYADPVGPPAPVVAPPEAPAPTPTPVVMPVAKKPKPPVREPVVEKPAPPATPPPQVATATVAPPPPPKGPQPILQRLPPEIEPRQIYFKRGGKQRVTVGNPHRVPLTIKRIELGSVGEETLQGYELDGADKCIKTFKPGERCRFNVVSRGQIGGVTVRVYYDPAVVGMTE